MSAAFTPGPWIVSSLLSGSENHRGFRIMSGDNSWALATVQPGDEDGNLGRANAHLIAAAPDLLAALADLLEAADSMRATYGCIQARHLEEDDTHTHDQWAEDFLQERADAARAAIAAAKENSNAK